MFSVEQDEATNLNKKAVSVNSKDFLSLSHTLQVHEA